MRFRGMDNQIWNVLVVSGMSVSEGDEERHDEVERGGNVTGEVPSIL